MQEYTGKEKMVEDWKSVLIAILKAQSGEMKVDYHKNEHVGGKIVGLTVDMVLQFEEPLEPDFTDEEIKEVENIRKALLEFEKQESKK